MSQRRPERTTLGSYLHAAMSARDVPTSERHTHRLDESSPGSSVRSGSVVGAGSAPVPQLADAMFSPPSVPSTGLAHDHLSVSATITRTPDASLSVASPSCPTLPRQIRHYPRNETHEFAYFTAAPLLMLPANIGAFHFFPARLWRWCTSYFTTLACQWRRVTSASQQKLCRKAGQPLIAYERQRP